MRALASVGRPQVRLRPELAELIVEDDRLPPVIRPARGLGVQLEQVRQQAAAKGARHHRRSCAGHRRILRLSSASRSKTSQVCPSLSRRCTRARPLEAAARDDDVRMSFGIAISDQLRSRDQTRKL